MAVYIVELNATVAGVDMLEMPSDEQYEIGQIVTIKTERPKTYKSIDGRLLTVRPGIQLGGKIVDKR